MMDVHLFVYDLSAGLAKVWSRPLTGIQIEAIYHTSLVFGDVEYFFGDGIKRKVPGTTQHGRPIEVLDLGKTQLPMEVIDEYVESLEEIYTKESYDLFLHNCNNFTNDLAMFLLGKEIPEHIRSLPQRFLSTPFGMLMKPAIDATVGRIAQIEATGRDAPRPTRSQSAHQRAPHRMATANRRDGETSLEDDAKFQTGIVHNVTKLLEIEDLLNSAKESCAVIFFTSATCAPCKIVYPAYDELAAEAGSKAVLMKVDLNHALDVSTKYQVRATPTFMTFLRGEKENEWAGADERQLRGNVQLLIQMAWPRHPHLDLNVPALHGKITRKILYKKLPPMDKLIAKLGPLTSEPSITGLVDFVRTRAAEGPADARLPDLKAFGSFIQSEFKTLSMGIRFAIIDLVRTAYVDPRVSGYFAEEEDHGTLLTLLTTNDLTEISYNLRTVMLQLACNIFTSPLYLEQIIASDALREAVMQLASSSMLDARSNIRFLASAVVYNLAAYNHNERIEDRPDPMSQDDQVEVAAALIEAIKEEKENPETLHGLLFALGLLLYYAPLHGDLIDLCRVTGVLDVFKEKKGIEALAKEPLLKEVGDELLVKGLA